MNTANTIYLDYASTHPRNSEVARAREQFENTSYANVGRAGYALAEASMSAYIDSKKKVAQWVGCDPVEILYTYSATYALNMLALALEHNGIVGRGDIILLSISEHHANIVPWQMLAARVGAQVKFVTLDTNHCLDLNDLKNKLDDSVKVVSFQYASNVTGAIHPLEKVREIIGTERLFFIDAAQMVLHSHLNMREIQCDALVFSGHKIMADTGIGVLALWKVLQKAWQAPIGGGGAINYVSQEGYEQSGIPERWEPGTPHITGAVTLNAALDYNARIITEKKDNYRDCIHLIDTRFAQIKDRVRLFHSDTQSALGVWSFSVPSKHPTDIADALAEEGICVRSGHHCCEPLHNHLGISGTVRISIGYDTTRDEVERFFTVLSTLL